MTLFLLSLSNPRPPTRHGTLYLVSPMKCVAPLILTLAQNPLPPHLAIQSLWKNISFKCVCVCWGAVLARGGQAGWLPTAAWSPGPSEKVWMRNDSGAWLSVGFAAASGNFQECYSGPAGGYFRCHFHEPQTPSVAGRPVEGNVIVSFSSALPLRLPVRIPQAAAFQALSCALGLRAPATQPACLEGASRQEEQPP